MEDLRERHEELQAKFKASKTFREAAQAELKKLLTV